MFLYIVSALGEAHRAALVWEALQLNLDSRTAGTETGLQLSLQQMLSGKLDSTQCVCVYLFKC